MMLKVVGSLAALFRAIAPRIAGLAPGTAARVAAPLLLFPLCMAIGLAMAQGSSSKAAAAASLPRGAVLVLDVQGGIGPATRDYLVRGLREAASRQAGAVVLRIDTPGGLDAATRDINRAILASKVPVIGWVGPDGARAASAGTYLLYACHLAGMASATSLGAATPVSMGGTPARPAPRPRDEEAPSASSGGSGKGDSPANRPTVSGEQERAAETAMERKAINDAVAYLRALAELRGRDAAFAEAAVRDAAMLTARQALAAGVVEIVAPDIPSLLRQAEGRDVSLGQRTVRLRLDPASVSELQPDWRARLLGVITEPTVAYLLLLAGLYGLVIEAYTPGALFPGVTGAICILLALYALQVLPVNYAGVALIVLGVGLMAAEFAFPSFGSLGIGGLVALVAGSLILFDTEVPGFGIPGQLVLGIAIASAAGFMALVWLAARARRQPVVTGIDELVGQQAVALADFTGSGPVRIRGEVWQARSDTPVRRGEPLRVLAVQGLVLDVVPMDLASHGHAPDNVP